jgi:DNA-binding NarL/FixJ family response regulator
MTAGVDGFVVKRALVSDLMPAIDAVLAGQRYFFSSVAF